MKTRILGTAWSLVSLLAACATNEQPKPAAEAAPLGDVAVGALPRAAVVVPVDAIPSPSAGTEAGPGAAPNASPFHDAVVSYPDSADAVMPNGLRLCPFIGRTFVCGVTKVPLLSTDDGVVNDRQAETSAAERRSSVVVGRVEYVLGHFPNDAWLVSRSVAAALKHAYRWNGSGWATYAEWHDQAAEEPVAMGRDLAGLVAAPISFPPEKDGSIEEHGLGLLAPGTGRASAFAIRTVGKEKLRDFAPTPVVGMTTTPEYLYVLARQGTKLVVDRRGGTKRFSEDVSDVTDFGNNEGLTVHAHLSSAHPRGPVVFGSTVREGTRGVAPHEEPLFFRWSDDAWVRGELPRGQTRVAAHDVGKVERIFTYAGETLSLFERPIVGGEWRTIPLPTLPQGDRISDVWLANDDAWLLITPKSSHENPPHLMRMKPVKEVWRVRE